MADHDRDFYEAGKPLSRRGLFQLVADEAVRDGVVEPWENAVLQSFARFLKLDPDGARAIARRSLDKFRRGALPPERPLHARRLYERTLFYVLSDGTVDPKEEALLGGLRSFFRLDERAHAEAVAVVSKPDYAERFHAGPPAPPDEPPPPREALDRVDRTVDRLFGRARAGELAEEDRAEARGAARELLACWRHHPDRRRAAAGTVARLCLPLVAAAAPDDLRTLLVGVTGPDDRWDEVPELFAGALVNASQPLGRAEPAVVEATVRAARAACEARPDRDWRWSSFADLTRRAARAAGERGAWATVARVVDQLHAIPEPFQAASAPGCAATLGEWADLLRTAGRFEDLPTVLDELAGLAPFFGDREVRATCVGAQTAAARAMIEHGFEDTERILAVVQDVVEVAGRYVGDRGVALPVAAAAPALLRTLLYGDPSTPGLVETLGRIVRRFPGDEAVARPVATGARAAATVAAQAGRRDLVPALEDLAAAAARSER